MFERFTVDAVAAEISRQVKGASPSPKVVHKFFRKGRRDGKKQLPHLTMESFVTEAVEIATSKLAEEFLQARQSLTNQLSRLKAERTQAEADLGQTSSAAEDSAEGVNPGAASGAGADLDASLQAHKAARKAKEQAAKDAERKTKEHELADTKQEQAVLETDLAELPSRYQQLVESAHHTGQLFWARYCNGYVVGLASRGAPDDENDSPSEELEFDTPEVLRTNPAETTTPEPAASESLELDTPSPATPDTEVAT